MTCYAKHRPVYCYVIWSDAPVRWCSLPLPVVIGPFKTKTGARNAFLTDHPNGLPAGVHWRVQQMIPYYTPQGHLGTLHFDQFIDPKVSVRAPRAKEGEDEATPETPMV